MAEAIKRVEIPFSAIPAKTNAEEYFLRYRIISEDQNITSAWTPLIPVYLERGADVLDGGEEVLGAS